MKKHIFSIVVIAAVLLTAGFIFTACDTDTGGGGAGGGPTDILDGTVWEQLTGNVPSGGVRLSFNSPNFEFKGITSGTVYAVGPYTVTGNSVSGTITDGESAPGTFTGAISGNTLQYTAIWYNGQTSSGTMTKKGSTGGGGGDTDGNGSGTGDPSDGGGDLSGEPGTGEPGTPGVGPGIDGGALAGAKGKLTLTGFSQFNGNYVYSALVTASGKYLIGTNGVDYNAGNPIISMVPISGGTAEVPLYTANAAGTSTADIYVPYEGSETFQVVSIIIVNDADGKFISSDAASFAANYAAMIGNNTSNTSFTPSTTNGSITISRSDVMTMDEITAAMSGGDLSVMQTVKYMLMVNP